MTPSQPCLRQKRRGRASLSAPRVSQSPWAGYTPHDCPRSEPLPRCPSRRCWRAKACIAAVDNLYCLRTHLGLAEQHEQWRRSPLARELALVPPLEDPDSLVERMLRTIALVRIRAIDDLRMREQWKSGALDHLYGPFRRRGVVLRPPPRAYVEHPPEKGRQAEPVPL